MSKKTVKAILHIRWQTDATEDLEVQLLQKSCDKWRHSDDIVDRVRQLAITMTDKEIANHFNTEGLITNKGHTFTTKSIQWIRYKHKIPVLLLQRPEELSINQVAEKFNVSHYVIRYWIERNLISARRIGNKLWISIGKEQEKSLKNITESSTKIAIARLKNPKLN